ncbi:hypothetical protein, partial [Bacillus inaquosorum]
SKEETKEKEDPKMAGNRLQPAEER